MAHSPKETAVRRLLIVLSLLLVPTEPAFAQVSVGIGISVPGVSIGINLPAYPRLVRVPDYPVYYAPQLQANFFFYDGLYWVFEGDNWYASSWYNGPWGMVAPEVVPVYLLRIPVRYYRNPPPYFRGWAPARPPRWQEHWGHEWQQRRDGWDRRTRVPPPPPAPLPSYQRKFPNERYPQLEQQPSLHGQNYRYQPREPVVRQLYQERARAPSPVTPKRESPDRGQGHGRDKDDGPGRGNGR